MAVITLRVEDDREQRLEGFCARTSKSRAEALHEIFDRGMDAVDPPAPAPAPQGGGTDIPQPQPELISYLLDDCRAAKRRMNQIAGRQVLNLCWPKILAALAAFSSPLLGRLAAGPFSGEDLAPVIVTGVIFADLLWQGREMKLMVAMRAAADMQKLIDDVPKAWKAGCRVKPPAAVELELIALIKARRARVGAYGVKDLSDS
jgi:hypothetical protein